MKTTLNLSISSSVLALILLACAVESAANPTNRLFRLDTSKSAKLSTTGDKTPSHRIPSSASPRSRPGSQRPDAPPVPAVRREAQRANIQSDIAYLPDVSVTCSTSDFVVRVKPDFYGLGAHTGELRLGDTCKSNGVLRPYGDLLFTYPLTACDAVRQSPPGFVVYKLVLHYEPSVKRFPRIDVDIECRYPRNYHVHQLSVQPTWKTAVVQKRLKGRSKEFHIELMDESWSRPARSQVYQLGNEIHFQVSAFQLPHGAQLYISSCYATPSHDSKSSHKYTIIDNFGCMLDSERDPGASQFVSRTDNTLRFSLRAFQFISDPEIEVKVQCKLFVTSEDPGPAHKSCTYRENRWEALTGDDSICECCDSQCVTSKSRRAMMQGSATSRSLLVSDQPLMTEEGLLPIISASASTSRDSAATVIHYVDELHSHDNQRGIADVSIFDERDDSEKEEEEDGDESWVELDPEKLGFREEGLVEEKNESAVTGSSLLEGAGSGHLVDKDFSESEEEDFEGEDEISQLQQMKKLNWKEVFKQTLPTEVNQLRDLEPPVSEEEEESREHKGDDEKDGINSEVNLRDDVELDDDGLMTWYFWR